ncbi:agouti-signaling protein 2b [Hoplias malabaricus]|uniref:agouti-signaling protein 2b n=1 Tax=Hoplias malabaricus TaxID=27720 RepID=UPI0034625801
MLSVFWGQVRLKHQTVCRMLIFNLRLQCVRGVMADRMSVGLCFSLCFVLSVVQSTAVTQKKHENDVHLRHISFRTGTQSQDKPKRLFARTHYLSAQHLHASRPKAEPVVVAPVPVRRCAGLMESCSGRTPCCEPCASCHCRLFNTICHCWRLGGCPKKT